MSKRVVIVGGGPGGLSAGIYTARAKYETVLVEKMMPGGNLLITERIDNYPGFPEGMAGYELAERMEKQYLRFGGGIIRGTVTGVEVQGSEKKVRFTDGREIVAEALIIASGSSRKRLGIPGEDDFLGKGVSYCAVCDGAFFKDKRVAVIGGGDSALEEALYLARFASECYLVHRRGSFRASAYLQEEVLKNNSIKPVLSSTVENICGDNKVSSISLRNKDTGFITDVGVDGVFVSIGQTPNVDFINGKVKQNPAGYIITNYRMETSKRGVYACGDVTRQALYQVVTACGEGATAAFSAYKYLSKS